MEESTVAARCKDDKGIVGYDIMFVPSLDFIMKTFTTLAVVIVLGVCTVGLHATSAVGESVEEQEQQLMTKEEESSTAVETLFYVIANETSTSSRSNVELPLWTPRLANPFQLSTNLSPQHMTRKDWWNIPGTFQIFHVLTSTETKRIGTKSYLFFGYVSFFGCLSCKELIHYEFYISEYSGQVGLSYRGSCFGSAFDTTQSSLDVNSR